MCGNIGRDFGARCPRRVRPRRVVGRARICPHVQIVGDFLHHAEEISTARHWTPKKVAFPRNNPSTPPVDAGFHAVEAKMPSMTMPSIPPTPCTDRKSVV